MKSSENLLKFIESWEGCQLVPYMDSGGRLTVGTGHLIIPGESIRPYTQDEVDAMLATDLRVAETVINHYVHPQLTQNQFDACVSLTFNIGQGNFEKSHFLQDINQKKFDLAADAILNWNHINGQVSDGLSRRRQAEREMFLNGTYETA